MSHADASTAEGLLACAGLTRTQIRALACETGFCQRASGKIDAPDFLLDLCAQSVEGTVSYNDLAARVQSRTGVCASRPAYWERTDEACVRFFQGVLERLIHSQCSRTLARVAALSRLDSIRRVLVQDSTILQLPLRLFDAFSGVRNAHAAVCNARIQGIYDLLSGRFVRFSVDPYSRNDHAAALDIEGEPGDLVLRDRGYFQVSVFATHLGHGAHTLTRYKNSTSLFDADTGAPLNLLALLKRFGSLDRLVLADAKVKLPLRLVALPVDEETANRRRQKAFLEVKGRSPSSELLELMSWTIFLTTLTAPAMTPADLLALYGLRWRIECIFKTWKSHFHFSHLHNVSERQLRVLLTARLIMITLLYERLFIPLARHLLLATGRTLSLMKFMRYAAANLTRLLCALFPQTAPDDGLLQALRRYCAYDRRRRPNFATQFHELFPEDPTPLLA